MPTNPPHPLKRVLFAFQLDASQKFGSLEEQVYVLAREFKDRNSLLIPIFITDPTPDSAQAYRSAGILVENLNLQVFEWGRFRRLMHLIRAEKIEVVHWNFYSPLFNWYIWATTVAAPNVEHYFTDHVSRGLPPPPLPGRIKTLV